MISYEPTGGGAGEISSLLGDVERLELQTTSKTMRIWEPGGLYSRILWSRNECWENVFEEKQACRSESGGWGRGESQVDCSADWERSLELSLVELSLIGPLGARLVPIATELAGLALN